MRACADGDLPSAKAAVAGGANVNYRGSLQRAFSKGLPLTAAVVYEQHDVVVWLLSHGARPNLDTVMYQCVTNSNAAILQLLIDAGGDVNRESSGHLLLCCAMWARSDHRYHNVRVLLAQPSLDFTIKHRDKTLEQYARDKLKPALADMIAQEVGEGVSRTALLQVRCVQFQIVVVGWSNLVDRSQGEGRWYDHCFDRLITHVLCSGCDEWCGCGVVGSRQISGVARWRLLTRRAWHGWCVACAVVALRGTGRLLCMYRSHVCWCDGDGAVRRQRV